MSEKLRKKFVSCGVQMFSGDKFNSPFSFYGESFGTRQVFCALLVKKKNC